MTYKTNKCYNYPIKCKMLGMHASPQTKHKPAKLYKIVMKILNHRHRRLPGDCGKMNSRF